MVLGIKPGVHANSGFLNLWLLQSAHLSTFETIPGHCPLSATSGARDHHFNLPLRRASPPRLNGGTSLYLMQKSKYRTQFQQFLEDVVSHNGQLPTFS